MSPAQPTPRPSASTPPLPRRLIFSLVMLLMVAVRPLTFLHRFLPVRLRELCKSWDTEMLLTFALSAGNRFHIDQTCALSDPATFRPLTSAAPEFRLTERQIQNFYRDGFLGPITVFPPAEMTYIRETLQSVIERPSAVYPGAEAGLALRDRHLDSPEFWSIIQSPSILERITQLIGPDIMLWRSQCFIKPPGAPEITWHQSSVYLSEEKVKPVLEPPDRNKLYHVTVWVAVDDATPENGCMHFLKGTHRKMHTVTRRGGPDQSAWPPIARQISGAGRFVSATDIKMEIDIRPGMVVPMPLKAGQCVIFSERCIHGSPPNISDHRRFGFVFRVCTPDVVVYRGETEHAINSYFKDKFSLKNWGCVMLRGEDRFQTNRQAIPPAPQHSAARAAAGPA